MTDEEILLKQAKTAEEWGYKPLPPLLSYIYRKEYESNIPEGLNINGGRIKLYSKAGTLLANGYDRIVIGDYGAFIEISDEDIFHQNIKVKPGEEYRMREIRFAERVKYHWYTPIDNSNAKLYYQQKTVLYADYKPNKWYISPHEIIIKTHPF